MLIWLIVIILAIVIEVMTTDLVSIWLVAGGIVGLLLSILHFSPFIQVLACLIVTVIVAGLVRPYGMELIRGTVVNTNHDRNLGKVVKVTKSIIADQKGEVILNNEPWSAISLYHESIEEGEKVEIIGFDGNKVIVKKK